MNATAAAPQSRSNIASKAWYATLVLIPLVTAAMLFWLRQLQVAHLAAHTFSSYGKVPGFTLLNQNAQTFGSQNLAGKIWVADFVYTTCPGPCPMISTRMGELVKPLRNTDVQLVSFSVDPEKDTPDVLRGYADNLHADASRWNFLTGKRDVMYSLIQNGFKLAVANGAEEKGQPVHSTRVALVDRHGEIRAYHDVTEPDGVTKLLADVTHLLREQPK